MNEPGDEGDRGWSRGRDALASDYASLRRAETADRIATGPSFGVGRVLATGFAVWFRNLIPFLLITALFYAPPWIWAVSVLHGAPTTATLLAANHAFLTATFLTIPLNVFVVATLTYGVVMELHGQRASIGACIATGLARFLPALGVAIVATLCVGVASMALVIPGIIVFCMLYVATPVSVLERSSVTAALSRSSELTRGRRWKIFGILVLLVVANMVSSFLVRELALSAQPEGMDALFDNMSRLIYVTYAHQVLAGSLSAVMASVTYYYLRAEKEGTSAGELAAIFD